jgi:hypothetical protein
MGLTTTKDIDKRMAYKEIQKGLDNVVSVVKVEKKVQKQKEVKIRRH